MASLAYQERAAEGKPQGLLMLHHGRGTDENDLLGLAGALDPERRLHIVAPRGPLQLSGWSGYHWYIVPRVGYPDPETFKSSYGELASLHDEIWRRTELGPEQTVLGGFSMGAVMSYALGLGGDRPAPAGILAFSGFVPTVEGWEPSLATRRQTRIFITHGRQDPIMEVGFGRRAHEQLAGGGLEVDYHESDVGHMIDPGDAKAARLWLAEVLI